MHKKQFKQPRKKISPVEFSTQKSLCCVSTTIIFVRSWIANVIYLLDLYSAFLSKMVANMTLHIFLTITVPLDRLSWEITNDQRNLHSQEYTWAQNLSLYATLVLTASQVSNTNFSLSHNRVYSLLGYPASIYTENYI